MIFENTTLRASEGLWFGEEKSSFIIGQTNLTIVFFFNSIKDC